MVINESGRAHVENPIMAAVVRWCKSGEVEITKFGPLKGRNDDSEGERDTDEVEGDQLETPDKSLHNEG